MKTKIIFTFFILTSFISFSQETEIKTEDNTIKGQFDEIFRISTAYQTYKVIDRDKYETLKLNVLDSLKNYRKLITEKENLLKIERENINKLDTTLSKTKIDLENALQKENSVSLFGAHVSKTVYNLILWFIIILLAAGLGYFVFKFSQSNIITSKAQSNLLDVEQELESYRKKSLEREQILRRQLQDEINKNRNA